MKKMDSEHNGHVVVIVRVNGNLRDLVAEMDIQEIACFEFCEEAN